MSTATTSIVMSNATDAGFRGWGKWISDQFAAFGWTLVGSVFATGTNWTDVTAPAAANTARVTELWRMNDSHQGSAPLFLLIDYGETATADTPAIRIRLGTGGSAPTTLSGQFFDSGSTYFGAAAINGANLMTSYASGDAGRISFSMTVSGTSWATTQQWGWGIERRINSSGASQATGWLFYRYASTSTRGSICFKQDGTNALGGTILSSMNFPVVLNAEANLTFDGKQGIHPMIYCGLGPGESGLNIVTHPQAAYGAGTTFSVTEFGSSHTYVSMGAVGAVSVLAGSAAAVNPAMRYE